MSSKKSSSSQGVSPNAGVLTSAQQPPRATPFGALLLSIHLVSQGLWSWLQ